MRESTAKWLLPMQEAANERRIDTSALMKQATMPAAESDSAKVGWIASLMPEGATTHAIDWIRFGELLRAELGWDLYPQYPEADES